MPISVKLQVFEGPLDLLLHLIDKNKIDIYDIPIVEITDQYLSYVREMDHEDMDIFLQDNYYYLCDVYEDKVSQELDDYEEYEEFTLEAVDYKTAIDVNLHKDHGPKNMDMLIREAKVLEMLHEEGYLK